VAQALRARRIAFAFATGYSPGDMPAEYADAPYCGKPLDFECLVEALARQASGP
jgi:hypothetical protein